VGTVPVWVGEFGVTVSNSPIKYITNFVRYVAGKPYGDIGTSWWPVNGTVGDGGIFNQSNTFYEDQSFGLLSQSWDGENSGPLMALLQGIQGP
jgi:hypothetical protein